MYWGMILTLSPKKPVQPAAILWLTATHVNNAEEAAANNRRTQCIKPKNIAKKRIQVYRGWLLMLETVYTYWSGLPS
jgi:hypothetical protein